MSGQGQGTMEKFSVSKTSVNQSGAFSNSKTQVCKPGLSHPASPADCFIGMAWLGLAHLACLSSVLMGIMLPGCGMYSIHINALCAMPEEMLHMASAALGASGSPVWPLSTLLGSARMKG